MTSSSPNPDPYGRDSAADPYAQWSASSNSVDPYAPAPASSGSGDPYAQAPASSGSADPYAQAPASSGSGDPYAQWSGPSTSTDPYAGGLGSAAGAAASGYASGPVQFVTPPPSSGSAIAGFVLGLVSLLFCAGLTAPFGLFYSLRGMKETGPEATSPAGGRGLAIAGLVCSILGLLYLLLAIAYVIFIVVMVVWGSTSA